MEQQPNKIRPMLLSALAQLSACLIVWNYHIPNPNILLFVVLSAVLVKYGYAAGIVSGLIAFLYSAFFFSTDHSFFLYTSLNFQKLIVIGLGIAANILLIGHLQRQFDRSSMEKMQAEAEEKLLQEKSQILLVDDSKMNRMILAEILGDGYHILEAANGQECLEKLRAEAGNIALVLLDINMPVMDGFEVLKAMNANHTIEDIPVIMISSEDSDAAIRRSYELGASDYVNRPFDARIVYRRVTNTIKLYAKQRRLVQMVSDQIRARENNTDMLVGVLSHIVEFRNGESGLHVRHIRMITELLLHRLLEISSRYSITAEQQDMIPLASALHDIGKIGIDEKILNKPGKLTPEEFEVIKTHSMLGAQILYDLDNFSEQPLLQTAYEIARWHHERWDGRGYPDGLKGDEIPISAQLVSLADVYDALTSERCYKKAFSHEKAMQMILNGECGAFNPLLLQCLTNIQSDLKVELQQHN